MRGIGIRNMRTGWPSDAGSGRHKWNSRQTQGTGAVNTHVDGAAVRRKKCHQEIKCALNYRQAKQPGARKVHVDGAAVRRDAMAS